MEALMLVEQIGPYGHPILQQRFTGAGTTCRVGRDLGCDVVVDDEHAAAEHAVLTLLEDGRVIVRDLGTRNGTRLNGKRIPADTGAIIADGEILIGRTRLLVRTRHTALGQERVFRREFVRRHRTPLAAAGVTACIAYAGFHQWLNAPAALAFSVTTAALVALAAIALWTGLWSLTTKLNQGAWRVRVHLTIASIGAAFCAWGYWVAGLVAFSAQWRFLAEAGIGVVAVTALAVVYLHLREATFYGRRVALALAAGVTILISVAAWIVTIGADDSDVNRLDLGPDVRLGAGRIVPNQDIAEYLAEVDKLQREAGRERQKSLLDEPLEDAGD